MENKVLIETSARHVHLKPEHVEILFGEGAKLEPARELTQPGLFACKQKVAVVGPKGSFENVTILGPSRSYTQIELSMTDTRKLGVDPVIRESGHLEDTPGCKLVGPAGEIDLEEGVLVAKRHIHMNSADAEEFGISDGDLIKIEVDEMGRKLVFDDVLARVHPKTMTFVHLDTDEGNAAGIQKRAYGKIVQ